jgi:hypothetical protein
VLNLDDELCSVEEKRPDSPHSPVSWDAMSAESSNLPSISSESDSRGMDNLYSENASYIRTILSQLVRITLAIRKSGNKYRFEEVDATCDQETFEPFRRHLTALVLKSSDNEAIQEQAREFSAFQKMEQASDPSRLTAVQKRLIWANVLRRNRIEYMMKSARSKVRSKPAPDLALEIKRAVTNPKLVLFNTEPDTTRSSSGVPTNTGPTALPTLPRTSDNSTVAMTATEPGSKLEIKPILQKKSFSTATKMTRIGASQVYPRCPKRDADGPLICPYCSEQLPREISGPKEEHSWR